MKVNEYLLSMIPKTSIIEIEEIRNEMKNHDGNQFWIFYSSKLNTAAGKIIKKRSRGYANIFNKIYQDHIVIHNPFEHPALEIQRKLDRIVKGWNAVETQMMRLRKGLEDMKKLYLIIESKTNKAGEFCEGRTHDIITGYISKLINLLLYMVNEMIIYEEKDMLIEIVYIIQNINNHIYYDDNDNDNILKNTIEKIKLSCGNILGLKNYTT